MIILILGLVLFLGTHSVRIFADDWRTRQIAKLGEKTWKGLYAAVSAVGLVLIVYGYGLARAQPVMLSMPPTWARHLTGPLTLVAFILLAAAYVPRLGGAGFCCCPAARSRYGYGLPPRHAGA